MEGRTFQAKLKVKVEIKCEDLAAEQMEDMDPVSNKYLTVSGGKLRVKDWEFLNLIPKDQPKQREIS